MIIENVSHSPLLSCYLQMILCGLSVVIYSSSDQIYLKLRKESVKSIRTLEDRVEDILGQLDPFSSKVVYQNSAGRNIPSIVLTLLFKVGCYPDSDCLGRVHSILRV